MKCVTLSWKSWTTLWTEQEWKLRLGRNIYVELTVNAVRVDKIDREIIFKKPKKKKKKNEGQRQKSLTFNCGEEKILKDTQAKLTVFNWR